MDARPAREQPRTALPYRLEWSPLTHPNVPPEPTPAFAFDYRTGGAPPGQVRNAEGRQNGEGPESSEPTVERQTPAAEKASVDVPDQSDLRTR